MEDRQTTFSIFGALLIAGPFFLAQGCVATRDWVKEQMDPMSARVAQSENRLSQAESQVGALGGRVAGAEGKAAEIDGRVGQINGRLSQIDTKAEKALSGLANLRLERKLVIDLREGAKFAVNNATIPAAAKKEIDAFLSDLKGDLAGAEDALFLVAGHTDSVGSEEYNYELGRRRAESVARYLIAQKKIDPLRVVTVSYGENNPATVERTRQGRAMNRRVEIMVYRDGLVSTPSAAPASTPAADAGSAQPPDDALTMR